MVGSAVIDRVSQMEPTAEPGLNRWHLADAQRRRRLRRPNAGTDPARPHPSPSTLHRPSTRSNISTVSRPVNVFCWLTWYDPTSASVGPNAT
jgi:hypothetical protein